MSNPIPEVKTQEVKKVPVAPVKAPEVKVEKPEVKPLQKEEPNIPPVETSINLIPTLTKEEVIVEQKKKKLNVGSIVSLLILVVISIFIVGFNIISKIQVNNEKKVLSAYESKLQNSIQKIISSNEVVDRVLLYKDIEGKTYSPKGAIEYINKIASKSGNAQITKFTFGNDLSFTIEGTASNLENVSKFWYLLGNDPEVKEVNLKSVGNTSNRSTFAFNGKMVFEYFLSSSD